MITKKKSMITSETLIIFLSRIIQLEGPTKKKSFYNYRETHIDVLKSRGTVSTPINKVEYKHIEIPIRTALLYVKLRRNSSPTISPTPKSAPLASSHRIGMQSIRLFRHDFSGFCSNRPGLLSSSGSPGRPMCR